MLRLLWLAALLPLAAEAAQDRRPVIVELFTSEGCSSCPPADAVLRELARGRPDVLALGFHVTYWDYLGWRDPFASPAATQRQRDYGALIGTTVYTPQMVIDGTRDVIGSEAPDVLRAIALAAAHPATKAAVRVRRDGDAVVVEIGAGSGAGSLVLIGYDREHRTSVARGENGGRSLLEANIVRAVVPLGAWTGSAISLRHALPAGESMAVIVQSATGAVIGAAREDGDAS